MLPVYTVFLDFVGFATVLYRTYVSYYLNTLRARGRALIIKPLIQTVFVFKTMPCLTRTPSRGPFVLARTVVLVSALALLGYLPAANPLTTRRRRERPTGNFASQNCRIRASGLNCFCRNLKHEARRVAEVPRSALREGGTAMLLIAAKPHQTIG